MKALVSYALGLYTYQVELTDGKGATAVYSGTIEFTPTKKQPPALPELAYKSLVETQIVPAGQNKRIYLPEYVGEEPVSETVDLGKTKLLDFDSDKRLINLFGKSNSNSQNLEVILQLADEYG